MGDGADFLYKTLCELLCVRKNLRLGPRKLCCASQPAEIYVQERGNLPDAIMQFAGASLALIVLHPKSLSAASTRRFFVLLQFESARCDALLELRTEKFQRVLAPSQLFMRHVQ